MLEALAELADFTTKPMGSLAAQLGELSGWAGLMLSLEAGWKRKLDTVKFTVTTEYNEWDWGNISWSMSKTYYKNGQSTKISNKTCKASRDMLDAKAIKALTDGLGFTFGHMPGPGREGPTTTTVTPN